VIVGVSGRVVVLAFVVLAALAVSVDDRRMVVLVLVVMGPVLELAERATGVMVRDVIVVMGVIADACECSCSTSPTTC
jgi:tRNA pseudouridine-54 N-methylase